MFYIALIAVIGIVLRASSNDRLDSAGERRWVDDDRARFSPRRNGCWDPRGMDEEAGCAWLDGVSFSHCFLNYK